MRSIEEIDENILELEIERTLVIMIEKDGEIQEKQLHEYDKFKANDNKIIARVKRKQKIKNSFIDIWRILPKITAGIFVFAILATGFLFSNKTAVANVVDILIEKYDIKIDITTTGETSEIESFLEEGYFVPSYLPEGYKMIYSAVESMETRIDIMNIEGNDIQIYMYLGEYEGMYDNETLDTFEKWFTNGSEYVYIENKEKHKNTLISKIEGVTIEIAANSIGKEELIKVFEGMIKIEKNYEKQK